LSAIYQQNSQSSAEFADAAPLFAALGDETRLRLVSRLCREGPLSITRLTQGTEITRQAVTKHLLALADAGIAAGAQHGREHVWRLIPESLGEARVYLDQISKSWDSAIERLRAFVETE
jgi:DNA-binding transcriptional ArsR family regulator